MVNTHKEYIQLLESELQRRGFAEFKENEILAFIRRYQLDKRPGIYFKDVRTDSQRLIRLHQQGKAAAASQSDAAGKPGAGQGSPGAVRRAAGRLLTGSSGKTYALENKPFSSGGEGDVFRVVGDGAHVVKVYHTDKITKELEEKLRYMAQNPPSAGVLNQVAWPMDVLTNDRGQFAGFLMPKLDISAELGEIYVYPPRMKITYKEKLILAQNICAVIFEVHKAGYVFGDFNPCNIGVNLQTGKVAFLDTDSYHIVLNERANKAYRCKVCLDGYVAPELIKRVESHPNGGYASVSLPTFTRETDNFALAIHIFKLLMNGYSPFSGINESARASTASPGIGNQAIKRDEYCFKPGKKPQAAAVPPAAILPDKVKKLFDRAFIGGKRDPKSRPDAREWYTALAEYEKSLAACPRNPAHQYKKGLPDCPWCAADERYRESLQPTIKQKSFAAPVAPPSPGTAAASAAKPVAVPAAAAAASAGQAAASSGTLSAQERIAKAASVLYPIGWIVFLANLCFCLAPFVENGSFVMTEAKLLHIDPVLYSATTLLAGCLLCFSASLKNGSLWGPIASGVWGLVCGVTITTIRYVRMGFNADSASKAWQFFGTILVVYFAVLFLSSKIGTRIRMGASKQSSGPKQKLLPFEIVLLAALIGVCAFCIPLLLDLHRFYAFLNAYNLFGMGIWIAPVVLFLAFTATKTGNKVVGSWLCAAVAVLFTCLVLGLATLDGGSAILLWFILAMVALGFIAYSQSVVDNMVSAITSGSFFVFFVVGASTALTVMGDGVAAVGAGAHWWTVAPAIVDVAAAALFSINELLRK